MKKLKISFDYDATLTLKNIQLIAEFFLDAGADVYILTSRIDDTRFDETGKKIGHSGFNMSLREHADDIGIKEENILFANGLKTDLYFKHKIDIHYDDLLEEVDAINNSGGCAILVNSTFEKVFEEHKTL